MDGIAGHLQNVKSHAAHRYINNAHYITSGLNLGFFFNPLELSTRDQWLACDQYQFVS